MSGLTHLQPRYHVWAPGAWINDPNGVIEVDGRFHLFFQHNPAAPIWADMHWGHVVSDDLVHWQAEPIALAPTRSGPDATGCWSGCAVLDPRGPVLAYTGRLGVTETVCLARGDATLRSWTKDPANPVLRAPASEGLSDFRDPRITGSPGDWTMIIGAGAADAPGSVLRFRSRDLYEWRFDGTLIGGRTGHGHVWECPDLFSLDGWDTLLYSVVPGAEATRFISGRLVEGRLEPVHQGLADLGHSFYAAQSLLDSSGRRLVWGWLREEQPVPAQVTAGWSGALSIPREAWVDAAGALRMRPVSELESLRGPGRQTTGLRVESAESLTLVPDAGWSWEARLRIEAGSGPVRLAFYASDDGREQTLLEVDAATGRLTLDRRAASLDDSTALDRREFDLSASDDRGVEVRVFADGSLIEAFVDGVSFAMRLYPTQPDSTAIRLEAATDRAGLVDFEWWPMAKVFDGYRAG